MKKYLFSADLLRVLAILGVIGVHLVIPITARPDFFGGTLWWLTFLLNCIFRMSVPLFIMLSGYLTLGKPTTIHSNWQRVRQRLVIPLVAYYCLHVLHEMTLAALRSEPYDYPGIFHNLSKNTHSSLYFLVILAMMQLLNPLWNLLTEEKNRAVLKYVWQFFMILGATAYIFYYLSLREGEVFSTFSMWLMWLGYYLYGYWVKLQATTLSTHETRQHLMILVISYTITVGFGYFTLWLYHHGVNDLFYIGGQTYADAYLSLSVIAMSMSAFNLFMRTPRLEAFGENYVIKKLVMFLASLSFALYLNHLIVLDTLSKLFGITPDSPTMPNLGSYLIISTVLTFGLTIPLAWMIKYTPGLKKIVGEK